MSPAKTAIASQLIIAASAGTGSRNIAIGIISDTAITAVNPGIAPITIPYTDDANMTNKTCGWNTKCIA